MENRRVVSGLQWIPLLLPLSLAIWACTGLVRLWGRRLDHPYDLEWMEGGMLTHAWRIAEGQPLYMAPSETFIPFIYPPGYAWLLATLSQWTPLEHALGRSLSLFGIALAASAIVAFVVRHRASWMGGWVSGLLCAAAFLLVYPASGAFYDLVRPDALGLGLMAWAMVLGLDNKARWVALGGVLLCVSFLMKHHAAAFGVPVFLALWSRDGLGRALWFSLWSAGPALAAVGVLQWTTEGHFLTYLLTVPATHSLKASRIFPGLAMELGYAFPILGVLTSLGAALILSMRWKTRGGLAFLLMMVVGVACGVWGVLMPVPDGLRVGAGWESGLGFAAFGVMFGVIVLWLTQLPRVKRLSWGWVFGVSFAVVAFVIVLLMRGHHGGYLNVYMPAHWAMALGLGVVSCHLLDWVKAGEGKDYRWIGVGLYALALCGVLFHGMIQIDEERLAPTAEDVAAGDEWVAYLTDQEGPVLSPYAPWLAVQAGHAPSFHLIALWDVHDEWHVGSPYPGTVERMMQRMEEGYWKTIVDTRKSMGFGAKKKYEVRRSFLYEGRVMRPKTGWPARPEVVRTPPAKLTPGLVRLPQWTGETTTAVESAMRLTLDDKYVWLQGRDTPIEDVGALLDEMSPSAVRIQAGAQTDLTRLQGLLVHSARRGLREVHLDVLTTTGRASISLLTRPRETDAPTVRVLLGDSHMLVTSMRNQKIVVDVIAPSAFPEGVSTRPVVPATGNLQDALNALARAQALGWRDVFVGIHWPTQVPQTVSASAQVTAFWQSLSAPQNP